MRGSILRRSEDLGLERGQVILTFDDGPAGAGRTEALLDLLDHHGIRAGFCVVGREVERRPEVCCRIEAGGHLLVNHSFAHVSPLSLTEEALAADLERCDAAIGKALGRDHYRSRWFRPPGGILSQGVQRVLARTGRDLYPITNFAWDIFPFPGNQWRIATSLRGDLKRCRAGVYILHEWIYPILASGPVPSVRPGDCPWLLPVVEGFIAEVKRQGAVFVEPDRLPQGE